MNDNIPDFIDEIIKKYNLVMHNWAWNYYVFNSDLKSFGHAIFFDSDGVYIAKSVELFAENYGIYYESLNNAFFFYNERKSILNHLNNLYQQFKIVNINHKINNINSMFK